MKNTLGDSGGAEAAPAPFGRRSDAVTLLQLVNFESFSASGGFASPTPTEALPPGPHWGTVSQTITVGGFCPNSPIGAPPLNSAEGFCHPDPLYRLLVFHVLATARKQVTYSDASIIISLTADLTPCFVRR